MEEEQQTPAPIKIFIGCEVTAEWRMHCSYSTKWKQANIEQSNPDLPKINHYDGKAYLGFFLTNRPYSHNELEATADELQKALRHYFPDYSGKNCPLLIFAQFFVG